MLIFFEVSRYLLNEQIKNFPFYNKARKAIPGEEAWKYQPNVGATEDKEYRKSLEWLVKHSSKKDLKGMFEEPKEPYVRDVKIGRNDPCPCDSGKKYKKCCGRFL